MVTATWRDTEAEKIAAAVKNDPKAQAVAFRDIIDGIKRGIGENGEGHKMVVLGRLDGIASGKLTTGQPDILTHLVAALNPKPPELELKLLRELAASPLTVDKPLGKRNALGLTE